MTATIPLVTLAALLAQTQAGQAGGYFSLAKIITMLILIVPWVYLAPWVQKDAKLVRAPQGIWTGAVLAAGGVGVLVWLLLPYFLLGMVFYCLVAGGVFLAYVVYRNGRVSSERRVLTGEHFQSLLSRQPKKDLTVTTRVKLYRCDTKIVLPPEPDKAAPEQIESYNLAQELLHDLLWRRVSEADLNPLGAQTRVRFVIDGVAVDRPALELAESEAIVQFLKPIAGMNAEERRRPQKGRVTVDLAGAPMDIEVVTAGTTGGQRMQLRVVQEAVRTRIGELGFEDTLVDRLKSIALGQPGLMIVSSPPGSGMTSTQYSLLRCHDAFIQQLVTLEAKPEADLDNVTQQTYKSPAELSEALASALRRDPDVILVDRCTDAATAKLIIQAATEKHVIVGIPAADTFTALAKWVKMVGETGPAIKDLRAVLCQMLLRKLCPNCREAYRPDPQLLAKVNLSAARIESFYRPPTRPLTDDKGNPIVCATCQGTGYMGRTAAFELLEMSDELRQLVAGGASLSQIKAACRKNKMLYLQEQALRKVIQGITGIQEVIRVSQQGKK